MKPPHLPRPRAAESAQHEDFDHHDGWDEPRHDLGDDRDHQHDDHGDDDGRGYDRYDGRSDRWRGREEDDSFTSAFGGTWRDSPRSRTSIGSFRLPVLPALPTPGPREAESLHVKGIWGLLVGAVLVLAAFAVLLFA